jgi:LysR family hydrogen peroxide-inducible transcriptional activator
MDLRQISTRVAIADPGSFSAAAKALFTVQSNVSAHIARLEKELGINLIDRSTGQITDEGNLVVERGRRILREFDDISADIAALDDVVSGDCRLGVIGTTGRWLMPQFLTRLQQAHPGIRPIISEGGTSSLIPRRIECLERIVTRQDEKLLVQAVEAPSSRGDKENKPVVRIELLVPR